MYDVWRAAGDMRAYGAREGIAGMYGAGDSGDGCMMYDVLCMMYGWWRERRGERERGIAPRL